MNTLSPVFNLKPVCFSSQELTEYLVHLAERNKELINRDNIHENRLKGGKLAMFMFDVCDKLGVSKEARFVSIELFGKFLSEYLNESRSLIDQVPENRLSLIIEKLKGDVELRAMSCIQIANKLSSKSISITCEEIRKLLLDEGRYFQLETIKYSEKRVLKCLDYRVNIPTPYLFMELLLEVLGHNEPELEIKIIYMIGCRLLEGFYFHREKIYNRLYEFFTGRTRETKSDRKDFMVIENDYLYLASSIIIGAAYILENNRNGVYEKVLDAISSISQIKKDDLNDFSSIICNFVLLKEQ